MEQLARHKYVQVYLLNTRRHGTDPFGGLGRAATTLAKATLTKGAADNLLPEDKHYEVDTLRRLFVKPKCTVRNDRRACQPLVLPLTALPPSGKGSVTHTKRRCG